MRRLAIILCFMSRVIYGTYHAVQHHTYSQHVSRKSRSNSPILEHGYVYSQFNDNPATFATFGNPVMDSRPFTVHESFESKSADKLRNESPLYEDLSEPVLITERIMPLTTSISKSDVDYEFAKAAADANYESSRAKSEGMFDNLILQHQPPSDVLNEIIAGYDSSNEFHMDDDDVRTSTRSLYDNWPYFYHSPYEYEHKKDIFDAEKAKDKRFAADVTEDIIPVHEVLENDIPQTPKYFHDATDNPIGGDQPFFSFVLNDYFERSSEEDPLFFKGLDWGRDFDHDTFTPGMDDIVTRNRRLEKIFYSTVSPLPQVTNSKTDSSTLSQGQSATENGHRKNHDFDKHENRSKKKSDHRAGFHNSANNFNGFKDFLDNFANKFGSEDHKKNTNYVYQTNKDKGENRKGFRRVYHKDEYQEDKEFYDNNNSSTKAEEKGSSNAHIGGSEAYLRSQAAAAIGNKTNAANSSGNTEDKKFEDSYKGHDRLTSLDNQFNKYIDVAKQAAQSNNADYIDHYKI